jgi:glycosyltransferase involved in cell wall biosynthesis
MAAIHHGCAILTTTPQVEIEMFADGENMVFVPPGDPTRLTETIRQLYEAPEQRERLRDGATSLRGCFD